MAKELRHSGWSPLSGVWFQFLDDTGTHYAEVDHLLLFPSHAVVIECKLTQVECAETQLAFYLPIVEKALGRKACGVIAVKHLRRETDCITGPKELATWDKATRTWHLPV